MKNFVSSELGVGGAAVVLATDVGTLRVFVFLHDQKPACVLLDLGLDVAGDEHGSVHPRGNHKEAEVTLVGLAVT